ncbi:hypothetical protein LINPERPRIM_LOCUS14645 [Linum perenne]
MWRCLRGFLQGDF